MTLLRRRTQCSIPLTSSKRNLFLLTYGNTIYFMSSRQSSNKQNSGRGAPNNGRGNGQPRPQFTPMNTSRPSDGHHSTASVPAIVNNLLGCSSNTSTTSSNQTPRASASNSNSTAPSEQARQQAEAAMKSMEEFNRQAEIQRKTQADDQVRTQSETLQSTQEVDDNVLHENHKIYLHA
jgi:hypothetical protein